MNPNPNARTVMKAPKSQERANRWVRIFSAGLLLWAGVSLLAGLLPWATVSSMVTGALFMLLFVPERVEDERVKQLKLKAITWGYVGGLLLVVGWENIVRTILRWDGIPGFSAFDVLIILTALALGLFRYWRWQDGRAATQS